MAVDELRHTAARSSLSSSDAEGTDFDADLPSVYATAEPLSTLPYMRVHHPFSVPFVQTNYINGGCFHPGVLTDVAYNQHANHFLIPLGAGLVSPARAPVGPSPVMIHPFIPWNQLLVPTLDVPPPLSVTAFPNNAMEEDPFAIGRGWSATNPHLLRQQLSVEPFQPLSPLVAPPPLTVVPPPAYFGEPAVLRPPLPPSLPLMQLTSPPPVAVHAQEPKHCPTVGPSTKRTPQPPVTRMYHGLAEDVIVFCNFNQLYKLDSELFACWMRILTRAPNAVIWLLRFPVAGEANILVEAQAAGVDPRRVIFSDVADKTGHIRRGSLADICLDTTVCNGHTTGMDILWGGTPLLTVPGDTLASRVSSSLVTALGIPELVCQNIDEYEDKAVYYATHVTELREIQHRVRVARTTSPLFNTRLRVRHLELAFTAMIQRWFDKLPPDHIDLTQKKE
jgi:hypothetical protein